VSGHGSHTIKLLPPLTINDEDCKWIETSFDSVIAASHKVPAPSVARQDAGRQRGKEVGVGATASNRDTRRATFLMACSRMVVRAFGLQDIL